MTPNTGPYDVAVNTKAVGALFDKIGPGILVTHSQSGTLGWRTAIANPSIKAVASYEPGGDFVFPDGEAPQLPFGGRTFTPPTVPVADFMQLTKIPIVIYYGDNIPDEPSTNPGQEQWRVFRATAKLWRDAVNRRGGDVTVVDLPAVGIRGNTHFPMSDLNNVQITDLLSKFLAKRSSTNQGPARPSAEELHVQSRRVSIGRFLIPVAASVTAVFGASTGVLAQGLKDVQTPDTPLVLKAQGSFFVGGEG